MLFRNISLQIKNKVKKLINSILTNIFYDIISNKEDSMAKTLDIVIPFYNEKDCVEELFKRLCNVRKVLSVEGVDTNFLFVNDGSSDNSEAIVENLAAANKFVKLINFSRNFGHEIAVTAGLDYSTADYTAIIDSDLQDPPELIKAMYKKIQDGYQIIYGQRIKRANETFFKKATAFMFYRLINALCDIQLPNDTGNFRLITADVRNALVRVREHKRYIRGIAVWVGFKSAPILYERDGRFAGETHYKLSSMIKLALTAIFEMSTAPLALINWLCLFVFLGAFTAFIMGNSIIATILLTGSILLFAISILGIYIGRIYDETRNRPLYIVDKTFNLD